LRPDVGYYPSIHWDIPNRIVAICSSLRIKAEVSKSNPSVVVADLSELLPKKARKPKRKALAPPQPPEGATDAQPKTTKKKVGLGHSARKAPPKRLAREEDECAATGGSAGFEETVVPFLREDFAIHFQDFPQPPILAGGGPRREAELVLVFDLKDYNLPAARDYVWDALKWVYQYPFVTVQFVTGPPVRSPVFLNPAKRKEVLKVIDLLAKKEDIHYIWKVPRKNESVIICRRKIQPAET
jgi:hypothetical protein